MDYRSKILLTVAALALIFGASKKVKASIVPINLDNIPKANNVYSPQNKQQNNLSLVVEDFLNANNIEGVLRDNTHNDLDNHLKSKCLAVMKNTLANYYPQVPYHFGEGDWINERMYDLLDSLVYDILEKTKYNLLGGWGNPWENLYDPFRYNLDGIWLGDRSIELVGFYNSFILAPPYLGDRISAGDWIDNRRIRWLDSERYHWFDEKQCKFLGWQEYPFGPLCDRVGWAIPETSTIVLLGLGGILALRKRK